MIAEKEDCLATERKAIKELKESNAEKNALLASEKKVIEDLRKAQEEKEKVLQEQKDTEAIIKAHLKEEEDLLASKRAAVDGVKEARITMEAELKHEKDTSAALERQIARKKSLITREEYVAKCLQHLSMHKREFMPPGAISYFVNAYFGVEYKAYSSMNFIVKETNLASNFVKTHIREQYKAVQRRRDESLASVAAAVRKRRDNALALVPAMPKISLPSVGPRSLVARLKSYGVNVDLFPKGYGVKEHTVEEAEPTAEEETPSPAPTPAPIEKKPNPESKLPKWKKLWTKKGSE